MFSLASLRSDGWTACPELVDDFIGIRNSMPATILAGLRVKKRVKKAVMKNTQAAWPSGDPIPHSVKGFKALRAPHSVGGFNLALPSASPLRSGGFRDSLPTPLLRKVAQLGQSRLKLRGQVACPGADRRPVPQVTRRFLTGKQINWEASFPRDALAGRASSQP